MQGKEYYKNGQRVYERDGDRLTYFFKTGILKAQGRSLDGVMQGQWKFYRESGDLWQIGNFEDGKKDGEWIRYNKAGEVEYRETFLGDRRKR